MREEVDFQRDELQRKRSETCHHVRRKGAGMAYAEGGKGVTAQAAHGIHAHPTETMCMRLAPQAKIRRSSGRLATTVAAALDTTQNPLMPQRTIKLPAVKRGTGTGEKEQKRREQMKEEERKEGG